MHLIGKTLQLAQSTLHC